MAGSNAHVIHSTFFFWWGGGGGGARYVGWGGIKNQRSLRLTYSREETEREKPRTQVTHNSHGLTPDSVA